MASGSTSSERGAARGVLIGLVGIALLIGGGTFALWYDTAAVSDGEITSGELSLDVDPGDAVWADQEANPIDIEDYLIVPGDVLTLTQPVTVIAVGDTLEALLSIDASGIASTNALAEALDISIVIAAPPAGITSNGDGTFDVVAADLTSPAVFDVGVTITFPTTTDGEALDTSPARANWWGQTAQDELVDLSDVVFDLQQTLD